MKSLSIHETKTHLSRLLHDVDAGQAVVFGERGKPQYQITKLPAKKTVDRSRAFGVWKGKVEIKGDIVSPDKEITKLLEDSKLFPA